MTDESKGTLTIEELSDKLLNFSIDREDVRDLLSHISQDSKINHTSVEYELHLLRIIAVGWSFNYYIQDFHLKQILSKKYWNSIQEFSNNISSVSSATIDETFNYFQIIKQRMDTYLGEFKNLKNSTDPTEVIGPKFAQLCGHSGEAIVIWAGSRMFQNVLNNIKIFISEAQLVNEKLSNN